MNKIYPNILNYYELNISHRQIECEGLRLQLCYAIVKSISALTVAWRFFFVLNVGRKGEQL